MIKPNEYNAALLSIRDTMSKYVDRYATKHKFNIQRQIDKLRLIVVNHYYEYLDTSEEYINPVNSNDEIEKLDGQVLEPIYDDNGNIIVNLGAKKQYDENNIIKSVKAINKILKTSFVINTHTDTYFEYAP